MKRFCKTSRNPKGFTLLELVVVIAIIGVLSTVMVLSISAVLKNSRNKAAKSSLENYWKITTIYFNQCNLGYGTFSEKQLKTRYPSGVLKSLSTAACGTSGLTSNNTIWVQYKTNDKSTTSKYVIVKITLRLNNQLYSTTNGLKIIGPSKIS